MSRARTWRRFRAHERFVIQCERNGATATIRHGYGMAHEKLMSRVTRFCAGEPGEWWR